MTALRALSRLSFHPDPSPRASIGARPKLEWLPLSALRVDPAYQREILRRGARNIRHILENFDWALFTPVICVALGRNTYAIVDGQHRATAALMHPAIREVPCAIVEGDVVAQARAFFAINAQVTKPTPLQLYAASLAGGDVEARAVAQACKAAGVIVAPYPKPRDKLAHGETMAIGSIRSSIAAHGSYVTGLAMKSLALKDSAGGGACQPRHAEGACRSSRHTWRTGSRGRVVSCGHRTCRCGAARRRGDDRQSQARRQCRVAPQIIHRSGFRRARCRSHAVRKEQGHNGDQTREARTGFLLTHGILQTGQFHMKHFAVGL